MPYSELLDIPNRCLKPSNHPLLAISPRTVTFSIDYSSSSPQLFQPNRASLQSNPTFTFSLDPVKNAKKNHDPTSLLLISAVTKMRQGEKRRAHVSSKILFGLPPHEKKVLQDIFGFAFNSTFAKHNQKNADNQVYFLDIELLEVSDFKDLPYIDIKEKSGVVKENTLPILFLHGWPDDEHIWDAQIDFMANKGYRCWYYTLPWYGPKKLAEENAKRFNYDPWGYTFEQIADGIMLAAYNKMENLGFDKVILCGHDWGAFHAQYIKARNPKLIERAIVVDVRFGLAGEQTSNLSLIPAAITMGIAYQYRNVAGHLLAQSRFDFIRNVGHNLATKANRWAKLQQTAKKFQVPLQDYSVTGNMGFHYTEFQKMYMGIPLGLWDPPEFDEHAGVDEIRDILFVFGSRKPYMFHTAAFIDKLNSKTMAVTNQSAAIGLPCGHWVSVEKAPELSELIYRYVENRDDLVRELKEAHEKRKAIQKPQSNAKL